MEDGCSQSPRKAAKAESAEKWNFLLAGVVEVAGRLREATNSQQLSLWTGAVECGRVWRPRFYDCVVFSDKKRVEKLRLEPEWERSSYRQYLLDEVGPVQVNVGWGAISFRDRVA